MSVLTFETVYGEFETPEWPNDLIIKSLREYGEWSYCEQIMFAQLLKSGDALWDGGAFLGTFGIGVAQLAHQGGRCPSKIVAIEPNRMLQNYLKKNLYINAPCPTELISSAIGPTSGTLEPDTSVSEGTRDGSVNTGARTYKASTANSSETVESRALWQLREIAGPYDAIKLDIEGMEGEALRGDFEYLRDRKPLVWAECNEALSSLMLLEVLVSAGYEPLYVALPAFRARSFRGELPALFPMAYEAALLAAPPERLYGLDPTATAEEIIVRPVRTSWDLRQALWLTPRWATPEWAKMSRPELVALLGRISQGADLGVFLNDRL